MWLAAAPAASAGPLAVFRTALGDIEVELYEDKPVTTANFIRYVTSGSYSNMFFHRWVPGFVMQGGGFYTGNRGTTNAAAQYVPKFGTITNEFNVGRPASNLYGTLAMAKVGGDPNSASSEWFFNLGNNSANLDNQNGGFSVFGRVVRGTNVLERFNDVSATHSLWLPFYGATNSVFRELPAFVPANPSYEDLLYCDIRLLRMGIRPVAAGLELSWNSVSNIANVVEYRTNFTQSWSTLTSTNGNGRTMLLTNRPPAAACYYRVRIGY
jgi:cyclophilin family peptidyl-prolyl cis-trans isomerase